MKKKMMMIILIIIVIVIIVMIVIITDVIKTKPMGFVEVKLLKVFGAEKFSQI